MAKDKDATRANPNCFGFGADNVEGCNCKKVFEEYKNGVQVRNV